MTTQVFLAFDTSAAHCAVALLWAAHGADQPARCETFVQDMAKGQAEALVPMIDELLARHSVGYGDLSGVCVGVGPGNFTGVRISVALARGLALGLDVPAFGVTGFEVAAQIAAADTPVWAVVDAPRQQFYAQRFDDAQGHVRGLAQILDAAALDQLDAPAVRLKDCDADQLVAAVAQIGAGKSHSPQPRPAPFYLRGADAAPPSTPPPVILP